MGNSKQPIVSVLACLRPENVSDVHCGTEIQAFISSPEGSQIFKQMAKLLDISFAKQLPNCSSACNSALLQKM